MRRLRHAMRFSLRTFLIVIAVLATLLAIHARRVRIQRDLVADIRGTIFYDYSIPSGKLEDWEQNAVSPVPAFLLDRLGVDFFHSVIGVVVGQKDRTATVQPDRNSLGKLTQLSDLRTLTLASEHLIDNDLAKLQRLKYLEYLHLANATNITDAGASEIAKNKNLRQVVISHSKITDEAVRIFAGLPNLDSLYLPHNAITNEGLAYLRGTTKLKSLVLRETHIDDEGMVHMEFLGDLEILIIDDCDVSGKGLKHLNSLKKLRVLAVDQTKQTSGSIQELKKKLPGLIIP